MELSPSVSTLNSYDKSYTIEFHTTPLELKILVAEVLSAWFEKWAPAEIRFDMKPKRVFFLAVHKGQWVAVQVMEVIDVGFERRTRMIPRRYEEDVRLWCLVSIDTRTDFREMYRMIEKSLGPGANVERPPGYFNGLTPGDAAMRRA